MTTDKAQNIKLEDRDPEELKTKLDRVVALVTNIKQEKVEVISLTDKLDLTNFALKANQLELKSLENEVLVKVRKPRALKPALKNPPNPRKERKPRSDKKKSPVIPGKDIDISSGLKPGETAPGDPRQAALLAGKRI